MSIIARRTPPGPRGNLLLGNLLPIMREPFEFATRCSREYGDVMRMRVGPMVVYIVVHPDLIEQVLRRDHRNFIKDKGTRMLAELLGEGLLTSEGETWRRQRRLAQPAFQLDQIQKYGAVMVACAERMLKGWQAGQTRDIHADMTRLTMEIAAQTLLGASMTDQTERVSRAMNDAMIYFAGPALWFPWYKWLPTPGNLRFRRARRELDHIMYSTIAQRRKEAAAGGDDLLSRLLAARDEDGSQMTDHQLRDELVTLFLAGHEPRRRYPLPSTCWASIRPWQRAWRQRWTRSSQAGFRSALMCPVCVIRSGSSRNRCGSTRRRLTSAGRRFAIARSAVIAFPGEHRSRWYSGWRSVIHAGLMIRKPFSRNAGTTTWRVACRAVPISHSATGRASASAINLPCWKLC